MSDGWLPGDYHVNCGGEVRVLLLQVFPQHPHKLLVILEEEEEEKESGDALIEFLQRSARYLAPRKLFAESEVLFREAAVS